MNELFCLGEPHRQHRPKNEQRSQSSPSSTAYHSDQTRGEHRPAPSQPDQHNLRSNEGHINFFFFFQLQFHSASRYFYKYRCSPVDKEKRHFHQVKQYQLSIPNFKLHYLFQALSGCQSFTISTLHFFSCFLLIFGIFV